MKRDKPVREMDAMLIRMPDGMKETIAQRARSNGRSASAEVVAILKASLGEPNELELRELKDELKAIQRQRHDLEGSIEGVDRRMYALIDRIQDLQKALGVESVTDEATPPRETETTLFQRMAEILNEDRVTGVNPARRKAGEPK